MGEKLEIWNCEFDYYDNLKLGSEIADAGPKRVTLPKSSRLFGYRTHLDRNKVCLTRQDAIDRCLALTWKKHANATKDLESAETRLRKLKELEAE